MITKLRVFYRKSDSQTAWVSTLDGAGEFPRSIEEELESLPDTKIIDSFDLPTGQEVFHLLGGKSDDYSCIEVNDQPTISAFMASDSDAVVKGKLVTGAPRPVVFPTPVRDLAKELDELKDRIKELEKKAK